MYRGPTLLRCPCLPLTSASVLTASSGGLQVSCLHRALSAPAGSASPCGLGPIGAGERSGWAAAERSVLSISAESRVLSLSAEYCCSVPGCEGPERRTRRRRWASRRAALSGAVGALGPRCALSHSQALSLRPHSRTAEKANAAHRDPAARTRTTRWEVRDRDTTPRRYPPSNEEATPAGEVGGKAVGNRQERRCQARRNRSSLQSSVVSSLFAQTSAWSVSDRGRTMRLPPSQRWCRAS